MSDDAPKKVGRPRKELNWAEFDKLCAIHATLRELAGWFECSEDTIETRVREEFGMNFSEYQVQRQAPGKMSLRRKLFEMAQNGNMTALIWLSKNHLGMADKIEQKNEITTPDNIPLTFKVRFDDEDVNATSAADPTAPDATPKTDL